MKRIYLVLLSILIVTVFVASTIYAGHTLLGFMGAGFACVILVAVTFYRRFSARIEDKILSTGLIQQYLLSNFTIDQSTLSYIKKLLKEDYKITVTTEHLLSAIEKEQTMRELELEREELSDFQNKFFIGEPLPETLEEYIKQFVTVFGRGSVRNLYYLKRVLEEKSIAYAQEKDFTDRVIALKNLIEAEIERRGGPAKKEEKTTVRTCPTCGNQYPDVLLYCPFCEQEPTEVAELLEDVVYCPQCNKPMVRSILKREGTFIKGYQCRNLKCLYEIPYEESHNTQ